MVLYVTSDGGGDVRRPTVQMPCTATAATEMVAAFIARACCKPAVRVIVIVDGEFVGVHRCDETSSRQVLAAVEIGRCRVRRRRHDTCVQPSL
jgi:hypothetical protein